MLTAFFSLLAGLVSVVNPIGAMPVFLAMTKDETDQQRSAIALRSCLYFAVILVIAFFTGVYVLRFFNITVDALRIAGGLIIFGSGKALLKGEFAKNRAIDKKVKREAENKEDISLTPLAIPMLSGPGSISYLIGIKAENHSLTEYSISVSVIACTALVTYCILRFSPALLRFLGQSGLNSLSRILGFIVMSIGVQYVIKGVVAVLKACPEIFSLTLT